MGKRRRGRRNFWECPECPEPERNTWCHFSRQDTPAIDHAIGFVDRCPDGSTILLAAYAFTVRRLAQALINAHVNRGCTVRVIIDNNRSSAQAKMIVRLLQDAGVPTKQDKVPQLNEDGSYELVICDCKPGKCPNDPPRNGKVELEYNGSGEISYAYKGSTIHHNKYIVEYREDGTGSVFTGSFNFSSNAQTNFENILVTRDWFAVQDFYNNFNDNWNDDDQSGGHFDFIPVEYVYDVEKDEVSSELAPVTTRYRGTIRTHDPYDEDEWASQN